MPGHFSSSSEPSLAAVSELLRYPRATVRQATGDRLTDKLVRDRFVSVQTGEGTYFEKRARLQLAICRAGLQTIYL